MIAGLKPYPVMKDSGVEWLGKIPDHWTEKRAKYFYREADERSTTGEEELLSVSHKTGVTPRKQSVTMFMAESTVGYKLCRPNDVAANTMWVFMGALGVSKQVGLVSPSYGVYRPIRPEDLLPEYVDRLLRVDGYKAEYMCRSTGINSSRLRLYPDDFLRIPIICPPISEQAAIVRYLDHVDRRVRRLVRAKRKLIALLTEQKQAIIHRAVTRGLDPDVPLKDSGVEWLGEVPAHWDVKKVKHLSDRAYKTFVDGDWIESPFITSEGIRLIQTGNIGVGEYREKGYRYINEKTFEEFGCTEFRPGDILICRLGDPVARACLAPDLGKRMITSVDVCILKPNDAVHRSYVVYTMSSPRYLDWVGSLVRGSTRDRVSRSMLGSFSIPVPPVIEQAAIVDHLDEATPDIDTAITQASNEITLLTEYRSRLTADVVTGKLDVREAAARLPEVDPLAADDAPDNLDVEPDSELDELAGVEVEAS